MRPYQKLSYPSQFYSDIIAMSKPQTTDKRWKQKVFQTIEISFNI